mmetsp:Transcript_428/g.469  ORF Transcript_428/g.469 Transcript_428/m.469 type:complete len:100 (+) Transcript_428:296-595(+)
MVDLNKIIFQDVISKNPCQVCTIIYNDVKDVFVYRLYRASDCSSSEKRIPAEDVARSCAPHYLQMLKNKMFKQLGERISKYYMKDIVVSSLLSYYDIKK